VGCKSETLLVKAKRKANILERIPTGANEEVMIRALARTNMKLSAIHHTVGTMCISTDEFLRAAALKAHSANQVEKVKKREALLKKQATQEKAKAVNTNGDISKSNLQLLLRWKLTEEEYKTFKVADQKKTKEELKTLWIEFKDREVSDIVVPPEDDDSIAIPALHETELGVEAKKLSDTAVAASKNLSKNDLKAVTKSLFV